MPLKIIKLRKSHERFISNRIWLRSMHSFSFAEHIDPDWNNFGKISVINEDIISPNSGFSLHSHSNMEIITIVTEGAITHRDSLKNLGKICKDEVQIMSAGTGISHSEKNEENKNCKLFQIWIFPNKENLKPNYKQISIKNNFGNNLIVCSSCGQEKKLIINQEISIWRCKYRPFEENYLPSELKKYNWIQLIDGKLAISDKKINSDLPLSTGDGLGFQVSDVRDIIIKTEEETDFLLFSMPEL